MKKLIAFFISIVFITKIVALDDFAANIAYEKAKSLVQKEEALGKAYKEYILQKALIPTFTTLLSNGNLQDGFSIINDFGKEITLNYDATNKISYIENEINVDTKSITKFYDYYYSNKNRIYTQAPVSLDSKVVKINLSNIEKFALSNQDDLLTTVLNLTNTELINKYLLENGVVTSYDASGNKEFTYNGKDIIIHSVVALLTSNTTISKLLDLGFLSVGSIIYMIDGNSLIQVIYLGDETFKQIGGTGSSSGGFANALLQITPYSGGYLLNGDIYSWGNNDENIVTINTKDYVDISTDKTSKASISSIVKLKSKSADTAIASQNYFSSPSRNKYVEFYSSSNAGTCAITLDYKLYCTVVENGELILNHIAFFDGATIKANKVAFYNGKWYVLVNGEKDEYDSYVGAKLYSFDDENLALNVSPSLIEENNSFKNIQVGNELFLLNNEGKINSINSSGTITQATNSFDIFVSLISSPNGVIAKTNQGSSFYIYYNSEFSAYSIDTKITEHNQYEDELQEQVVYSDAIVSNNSLKVIWINGDGKIKGDVNVLNYSSSSDDFKKLEYALISSSWKKIKFVTENTICAIDSSYQLYCWGDVGLNNSLVLPTLNSNQFDKFVEDGDEVSSYKLKYPTYISGFNYDFIFK